MRTTLAAFLLSAVVSVSQLPLAAQVAPPAAAQAVAQVEVTAVKFAGARSEGGTWLEAEVELMVKPGGRPVTTEFVNGVRTTLSLGFEVENPEGAKAFTFYRAGAEAITLKGGKTIMRFYLPPEVVERDRLRPDVKYYVAEVEVAGAAQPPTKGSFASRFENADSVRTFQSRVTSEGGANEGILMPQYLTPFANDSRRPAPTFLRREAQR